MDTVCQKSFLFFSALNSTVLSGGTQTQFSKENKHEVTPTINEHTRTKADKDYLNTRAGDRS